MQYEECRRVKGREDSEIHVVNWVNKLKKEKFNQKRQHMALGLFIRNLKDYKLNKILKEVYNTLMDNKLKRDQLVFNYVLQKYNFSNYTTSKRFSLFK